MSEGWNDPRSEMNPEQKLLVDSIDGIYAVDAGPGTGKTSTISRRYISLLDSSDVEADDILMLTFSRNAAKEMDERIKSLVNGKELFEYKERKKIDPYAKMGNTSKKVMARTFDSLCRSIVLDSAEFVGEFFGIKDVKLTRNAYVCENEIMNKKHFKAFFDVFIFRNLDKSEYGDIPKILQDSSWQLYEQISQLMSRGIIPYGARKWFGYKWQEALYGTYSMDDLKGMNTVYGDTSSLEDVYSKAYDKNTFFNGPEPNSICLSDEELKDLLFDPSREALFLFIHDVYLEYIRESIRENRLTFSLTSLLAFTVLYKNKSVRERNGYKYLTIDEFQDTNALQMMIALMITKEPNICVVGDWKQSIYGFRFADLENLTKFDERIHEYIDFLNSEFTVVDYPELKINAIELKVNYRSSQKIIDASFRAIESKGNKDEVVSLPGKKVLLKSGNEFITPDDSEIRFIKVQSIGDEAAATVAAIQNYTSHKEYEIIEKNGNRHRASYGDIAVLCISNKGCRSVLDECRHNGIPAFLQGSREIMSTREGKLLLAWLKFINDPNDPEGYVPIIADASDNGYSFNQLLNVKNTRTIPGTLSEMRNCLCEQTNDMTFLLCSIFDLYSMDNDVTQALIRELSLSYSSSMMTLADIIGLIEDGIRKRSTSEVENIADVSAVRIMTMHQSKGLEFPIVIIPYMDRDYLKSDKKSIDSINYDSGSGIRVRSEVGRFESSEGKQYMRICDNWRTVLLHEIWKGSYDETRRALFVAMSRASQYETCISSIARSSHMFTDVLNSDRISDLPKIGTDPVNASERAINAPVLEPVQKSVLTVGIHDYMNMESEECTPSDLSSSSEESGKKYGKMIHRLAEDLFHKHDVDCSKYSELTVIKKFLDSLDGYREIRSEEHCWYPVPGTGVVLHGIMDLMVVYEDHVEVHDYKTDSSRRFEDDYRFQLSAYARALSGYYNIPARCFIRYVKLEEVVDFEPLSESQIADYMKNHEPRKGKSENNQENE